jgi:hypothetical protein
LDSYCNFASFSCSLFFQILYCLKIILNIQNNIFADFTNFVQFLRSNFQTVYWIDSYDMPLESYWLGATFIYIYFSPIIHSLRADLKKHDSTFLISYFYLLFLGIYFRTTCRNVPTEILLKRYWLSATFSFWIFYSELPRGTMWTSGRYEVNCHFDQSEFQQNVVVRRILKWTSMRWKVYFHAVQSEIHFLQKWIPTRSNFIGVQKGELLRGAKWTSS